jgi:hypothetical protein
MQTFYSITLCLVPGFAIFTCLLLISHFYHKDKIYRYPSDKWLEIKEHPIPDDIRGFLATDGKTVDYCYTIKWAPHGKIYFSEYSKTYISHWMPLPDVPEK